MRLKNIVFLGLSLAFGFYLWGIFSLFKAQNSSFLFFEHYWCDLFDSSKNVLLEQNRIKIWFSTFVLSLAFASFWCFIPPFYVRKGLSLKLIRSFGMLSMLLLAFVGSSSHDSILLVSGFLGAMAFILFLQKLHPKHPFKFYLGIFSFGLMALCELLFFSGNTKLLPFFQNYTKNNLTMC
ncbi:MAG: hypothetical protein C4K58_00325 [Flavobacteriaceae bacterium]|nr:MAG: hypothetical protein C4K58_00325 [Flavobacteriaceae bacterium]